MNNCVDLTIIGGGPVGLFAAFYAGLRQMSVRIIDSLPDLGGQLTALYPEKYVYDMPGFPKVLAKDLAKELEIQGLQFGAEVVLEETAEHLDRVDDYYRITTVSGKPFDTRTLIIAAGAGAFSPTKVGVEREEEFVGKGLAYGVRDTAIFRNKRVGIVGGGDSALDWCMHLESIAKEIVLIHRRDQFRAHEDSVEKVMSGPAKKKLWNVVVELHGDAQLTGVTLENTQTKVREQLELDALVVNIGFKSSLGPIKEWGLEIEKNQIVVNRHFETNLSGIFAVGDVCRFEEKLKLIATGVGEAVTAVCMAKLRLDPAAKLFPGHSSELDLSVK